MGNRIWRQSTVNGVATGRKYIVDISGELPTILCEIDDPNSCSLGSLKTSYIYADGQILSQRIHTDPEDPNIFTPYYYVHDRLGSIRLMINNEGAAVNSYTYKPYGQFYDGEYVENVANPWKFTGQYYDVEIEQYYLRARQYDPQMMRFTSRDPKEVEYSEEDGVYSEPSTLHKYLYSANNSINQIDPSGESAVQIALALLDATTVYAAGLEIAVAGVEYESFDLLLVGAFIQGLSPLVFSISYETMGTATRGSCFVAGTKILSPCGEIPIEQIQVGWLIWAAEPLTRKPALYKVVQCYNRETDELVLITVKDEIVKTTPDHPFYVYNHGWCRAGDLKVGTELVNVYGDPIQIDKIEHVYGNADVFNLEIDCSHTYYVSEAKLLVHNNDCTITIGEILRTRKGGIRNAPLPKGSPSWEEISRMTFKELEEGAKKGLPGFKTIKKLLTDGRFKK